MSIKNSITSGGGVEGLKEYPKTPEDWGSMPVKQSESELYIGDWQVMQSWEKPLMQRMAQEVTISKGDILEIGYGMGISANEIIHNGCKSYTVIEAHPEIAKIAEHWAKEQSVPVKVVRGLWQKTIPLIEEKFDGILFDVFPLTPNEYDREYYEFLPVAPRLLKSKGVLTYYSAETMDFRRDHLELLLKYFDQVKLIKVNGLKPFPHTDYWKQPYMIIPVASTK
jgi:guanidinoacetate N-methyltransferase